MRRTFLIVMVFVPALIAAFLYRAWRDEAPRGIRQMESDGSGRDGGAQGGAPHAATSGRQTFFIKLGRADVDGESIDYRAAYYHLAEWSRDAEGDFHASGLSVVMNPRPRTREDLETLLEIRNDDPDRGRLILEAVDTHTSIRAGSADISGGASLESFDRIALRDGVEARFLDAADPVVLRSEQADGWFENDQLTRIEIPGRFEIERRGLEVAGEGLRMGDEGRRVLIERNAKLRLAAKPDAATPDEMLWPYRMACSGPLVLLPESDDEDEASGGSPFTLGSLHRGTARLEGDVRIKLEELFLSGDLLTARFGPDEGDPSGRARLQALDLDGAVSIASPLGIVSGERAEARFRDDGSFQVTVLGDPVKVTWEGEPAAAGSSSGLNARCSGELTVTRPPTEAKLEHRLHIALTDDVKVNLADSAFQSLALESDALDVYVVEVNSQTEESQNVVLGLGRAVLTGNVRGVGDNARIQGPEMRLVRRYDARGLHEKDRLDLSGPGLLTLIDPKSNETLVVEAKQIISVERTASPFADSVASAAGTVHIERREGGKVVESVDAETVELVTGPEDEGRRERNVLKSLIAERNVKVVRTNGSELNADRVHGTRERVRVTGSPAVLHHVDSKGNVQGISAPSFDYERTTGRLVAKEGVEASVFLPDVILASDGEPRDPFSEDEKKKDPWKVSCRELQAVFMGTLPFASEEETDPAPTADATPTMELREIDAKGDVRLIGARQAVTAEHVFFDFSTRAGHAEGSPVILTSRRTVGKQDLEDRIAAPKILIRKDWTLFEGSSEAKLHVRKKGPAGRVEDAADAFEVVEVRSSKDVLLKDQAAVFSGRTRLTRGDRARQGLEFEANRAVVRFVAQEGKGPLGTGRVQAVEAVGDVRFSWEVLHGEGDVLVFDENQQRVVLKARQGKRCRMVVRGTPVTNEVVIYDMKRKTVDQYGIKGRIRRGGQGNR